MRTETLNTNAPIKILLGAFSVAGLIQIAVLGYQFGQWIKAH